jgi:hypothetical protein
MTAISRNAWFMINRVKYITLSKYMGVYRLEWKWKQRDGTKTSHSVVVTREEARVALRQFKLDRLGRDHMDPGQAAYYVRK